MNRHVFARLLRLAWPLLAIFAWPLAGSAQVAVPEIEELEEYPTISATEIEELIGPIALYPDDLLAIVLPASTYPLQVVEAARFLEDLEDDPTLKPDEDWDDSVVALVNYPEVVELMNEDLDWTWRLGEAVVGQQSDVIAAIEDFRDQAYAAGNLKSDDYQLVSQDEGTIQITPVQDDVIYVPYYEPEEVVVYQPRPVYYYYPRAYPVYYYPYPSYYSFRSHFHHDYFWGVTTAFSIGWHSYHLNTYHHSFYGHPYYGHSYWDRWWYRRPDIHVYNNTYVRKNVNVSYNRYRDGDHWAPRTHRSIGATDQRITRTRYYPSSNSRPSANTNTRTQTNTRSYTNTNRSGQAVRNTSSHRLESGTQYRSEREPIQFRERPKKTTVSPPSTASQRASVSRGTRKSGSSMAPSRTSSRNEIAQRRPEPVALAPRSKPATQSRSASQPRSAPPSRQSSASRSASRPKAAPQRASQTRASQSRSSQSRSSQSRSPKSTKSGNRSSRDTNPRSSRRDH